ncbi:MAG TPA: energy transducer TonB [Pyrinomonadaceae bacterium]|nr:energy transducer TonB [Pyrinomonadaceae bacterium]
MKRCNECGEEFDDKFFFCPVDGTMLGITLPPLDSRHSSRAEFQLTLISDEALLPRLASQLSFVMNQAKQAWPSFRSDPRAFSGTVIRQGTRSFKQNVLRPHVLSGVTTALFIVGAIVLGVLVWEKRTGRVPTIDLIENGDELVRTVEIDPGDQAKHNNDSGVGVGDKGRVGVNKGKGEGSGFNPARSQGGGGGGDGNPAPASRGRVPIASIIPAPISTTMARLPKTLPDAGIDIDAALWRNLSLSAYGDPRSKSTTHSNGPGEDGGVGTNKGTGIGEGEGPGFGPGRKGNIGDGDKSAGCCGDSGARGNNPNPDPNRVYSPPEVNERARVLSKPEPQYTEEARRTGITGTVILRVVFSRTGEVTNIRAMQPLGGGLTEKAIAAARQIRFVPAKKNGQPVSMYMQLEYNFNLY